jgi:hypothetical protein
MASSGKGGDGGGWIGPVVTVITVLVTAVASIWSNKRSEPRDPSLKDKLKDLDIAKKKYNLSEEEYQQQKKKILETHKYETHK